MSGPNNIRQIVHEHRGDLTAQDLLERQLLALGLIETSPEHASILDGIDPEAFMTPSYGVAWRVRQDIAASGRQPDIDLVSQVMDARGLWGGKVEGYGDLVVIAADAPAVTNLPAMARQLRGAMFARRKALELRSAGNAWTEVANAHAEGRDAAQALTKAAELEAKAAELRGSGQRGPLFVPITEAEVESVTELVDGMFAAGTLGMIAAPGGSGKTFAAVALSCSVVTGRPFLGHAIRKAGPVLYYAAEGRGTIRHRAAAWARHHGMDLTDLAGLHLGTIEAGTLRLVNPADAEAIIAEVEAMPTPPAMIVVDTIAMGAGLENENDNALVSILTANLLRIAQATGALVLTVHHTSKADARSPRGASALRDNIDTLLVMGGQGDAMTLKLDKYRHGMGGTLVSVKLDPGYIIDEDPTSDRAPRATPVLVEGRGAPVLPDEDLLAIIEDAGGDTAEGAEIATVLAELELYGMNRNALNRRVRALRKAGRLVDPGTRGRLHLDGAPAYLDGLVN